MANFKQDCGILEDNVRLVKETVEKLGGLDIIVANAGQYSSYLFSTCS